jgi:hypothetical protein
MTKSKIYTIYLVTNKINGKTYVGFTSVSLAKRQSQHEERSEFSSSSVVFHNALKKWGFKNFIWQVIYQSLDRDHTLKLMEAHFISEFKSHLTEHGYNMSRGGEGTLELVRVRMPDGSVGTVHCSDYLYTSGKLVGIAKNTVTVRDKEGNKSRVNYDDPRFISGELVPSSKGFNWYYTIEDGNIKNGTFLPGTEPVGWLKGMKPKVEKALQNPTNLPMKWYNNGTDSYQYIIDQQPEGWVVGRIISQDEKDKRPYNNGEVEKKFISGTEPEGFVRGRLPKNKTPAAGTKRYNNGTINKGFIPGTEPAGWVLGEIPRKSGTKKYYNNGIEQKGFVPGTEPNGWVLGGLPKVYLHGKRWYNHGNEESKFIPGTEPEGWLLGRKDSAK